MFTLNLAHVNKETWNQFYFYAKQGSRNEILSIVPKGFTAPIYLRRSTSDIDNFIQIYLKKEYECLAACTGAPMMMVNHKYIENLTIEKVDHILDQLEHSS